MVTVALPAHSPRCLPQADADKLADLAIVDVNGIFSARPYKRADLVAMFQAAMSNEQLYPPQALKAKM